MAETAPNGDRMIAASGDAQPTMDFCICTGPLLQADAVNHSFYNRSGRPARVIRVDATTTVIVATADAVTTVKNNAAEALGTLTIATSGSAVNDFDTTGLIPQYGTYSPIIADGEVVTLSQAGASTTGEAIFLIWLRPCVDGVS